MASGPEHYREAERLLTVNIGRRDSADEPTVLAAAQVHATLALAAATVDGAYGEMAQYRDEAWDEVTGP